MKNKLIKKHLQGSLMTPAWSAPTVDDLPIRKYYWKQWTPEMKVKTDYSTGEPLDERWKVLVDDLGNVVDTSNPQVLADYDALSGKDNFKAEHPGVTFTFDKTTKQKFVSPTTETADERIERLSASPIATQELWELIKLKEDEERYKQTPEGHLQWLHERDAEARNKTPGAGMLFAAPVALGVGTTMFLANPLAFTTSLIGAKIGETTLNHPFQQLGYKSFGDWWLGENAPQTAKELSNLGTWLGGGAGYSTAKMYQAAVENLAKRFGTEWATKSLSTMYPAYNPYPQLALEVPATEISSTPLRSSKLPGIFFAKAGEANKGSVSGASGNWQIKALMPGNALERKMAPDGTISWKDFEWYLKQKPVEPYDRIHLQKAAESFSKDEPIPYEELKKVSSDMIPKFDRSTSDNLKGYGLDALGLGTKTDVKEHYGFANVVLPDDGVHPESIVFNNPIGSYDGRYTDGRVHFPNATLHMRGFTIDSEPGIYYYLEGQSDWTLLGLKYGLFSPGSIEEHMGETALLRGIQEALLRAAETGNSVMRIPTPETLIKSQYWKQTVTKEGRRLIGENSNLANQKFNDFLVLKYPEVNTLRQLAIEAESAYNKAMQNLYNFINKLKSQHILRLDVSPYSSVFKENPSLLLPFNKKYLAEDIEKLNQEVNRILSEYEAITGKINSIIRQARRDPEAINIEELSKLIEKDLLKKYMGVDPEQYQRILDKYKAFPKHFRRLFGDKASIQKVIDTRGNTWFEVDVPKDITTRDLLFSKVGEINEGSASGLLHKIKTFVSRTVNPISEKNLANVSLEEIESAILMSLEKRNFTAAYRLNKLYLRKKFQLDHLFSFEPKIENTLSNVTPVANVTRENIGTLSPELINATYSYYATNKDYTSAEKFRNLYRKKFGEGEPITMDNKESIPDVIWDILYFKALKKNNLLEATRLRDLHFLAKSKNNILYTKQDLGPIRYYHSTDGDNTFNVFDFSKVGTNYSQSLRFNRPAFFFTPNLPDKYWGDKTRAFFLNAERPATNVDPLDGIPIEETRDIISKADSEVRRARPVEGVPKENNPRILTTPHRPYWEMVMFDPKKIKLTDPITKDGENIIPLSWRDNFDYNNVLFSKIGEVNKGSAAGNFDLKNFLDRLYKARKLVEEYLGSEKHVKLIMKSGVSKKEALVIANEMKNNALKVKHRFSSQAGMDSSYARNPKDNGKISPSIKIGKDSPDIEAAVYHEYGGHAATLGLLEHDLEKRATTLWGGGFPDKYWKNILRQSPNLLKINKHNLALKPIRLPKYLVPDSELNENDKFWLDYFENVDEYSTIARAANIGKGNYHAENDFIDLMKNYFTPESLENLRNLVWSKTGEINSGSVTGETTKETKKKIGVFTPLTPLLPFLNKKDQAN